MNPEAPARPVIPFVRPEIRSALFAGRGEVRVETLVGDLCSPFTAALHCQLAPLARVGEHLQESDDELVIGLRGEAWASVGGAPQRVRPGSVVALCLGQTLSLENRTSEPFEYLIIKARSGAG